MTEKRARCSEYNKCLGFCPHKYNHYYSETCNKLCVHNNDAKCVEVFPDLNYLNEQELKELQLVKAKFDKMREENGA